MADDMMGGVLQSIFDWIAKANPEQIKEAQLNQALSGEQRNAYEAIRSIFEGYGLGSLAPKILEYVQQGYGSDTITMLLQRTDEYKRRFSANEIRRKNGLPVLAPNEYLATEQAYRQIMRNAGLPQGFYDSQDDFARFLSSDVSPTELKNRVDLAVQATEFADPALQTALRAQGVSSGSMVAYFLDEKRAMPLIQKQMAASQIGAAALRNNLTMNAENAMEWAQQGYGQIAGYLPEAQRLATIYGDFYNQATAEAEIFGQSGEAGEKRKKLASQERASFGGSVGAARRGLAGTGGQQ